MSHWPRDGEENEAADAPSESEVNADAVAQTLREKQNDLDRMIEQGRSFSGHERHCVFLNTGEQRFANVSAVTGLDFDDDGRAVVAVDWDQDGDLDLWVSNRNAPRLRLLRNDSPTGRNFLSLRLQGDGTTVSRDAIGARVEVVAAELDQRRLIRTLRAGEGYLAQSSKWVHFGLDDITAIDKVVVRWPHGQVEEFTGLEVNQRYRLVQNSGLAQQVQQSQRDLKLAASVLEPPPPPSRIRVPLLLRLPLPEGFYFAFDGGRVPLSYRSGKQQLISFWTNDCANCRKELVEFTKREQDIRAAGIEVIALSLDALGEDRSGPAKAAAFLNSRGFPFEKGLAVREFVQLMQGYHNMQVFLASALEVPVSFLVDKEGRIKAIYKGNLSVDQLIEDAGRSPTSLQERIQWAACLPGRTISAESVLQVSQRLENKAFFGMAQAFAGKGFHATASRLFQEVLKRVPDFAEGHQRLAIVLEELGQSEAAVEHYRDAIRLETDNVRALYAASNALLERQLIRDAVQGYEKVIAIDPAYKEAHVRLGDALVRLQEFETARAHYERAIEIDPDFRPATLGLQRLESSGRSSSD